MKKTFLALSLEFGAVTLLTVALLAACFAVGRNGLDYPPAFSPEPAMLSVPDRGVTAF